MAVLKGPLDWGAISRLSKDYDFYEEFGRTVVRLYPRTIRQPGTDPQRETWRRLKQAQRMWLQMGQENAAAWNRLVAGSNYRGRDYFTKKVLEELSRLSPGWTEYYYWRYDVNQYGIWIHLFAHRDVMPEMHYRYDLDPHRSSPATWSDVGHKIRNKRVLRRWELSLDLPNVITHADNPAPGWWRFLIPTPPPGKVLWTWFKQAYSIPDRRPWGSSGLYKQHITWPIP